MRGILLSLCIIGCSSKPPAAAADPVREAPEKVVREDAPGAESAGPAKGGGDEPAQVDARHRCAGDEACMASCMHGAVSWNWYLQHHPGGEACEDGCTSKGTEMPKCEEGRCVAYREGRPDEACTGLVKPIPAGPGPAHRCASDEQCRTSCKWGAVTTDWYTRWDLGSYECKDGCAGKGATARCEEGICTTYFGAERSSECTTKPAFPPER